MVLAIEASHAAAKLQSQQQDQQQQVPKSTQQQQQGPHNVEQQQQQQQQAVGMKRQRGDQPLQHQEQQQPGRREGAETSSTLKALLALGKGGGGSIGQGSGLGGKGGSKSCVPCTMMKFNLATTTAAKEHADKVKGGKQHEQTCPFCKCKECKQKFTRRNEREFMLKKDCRNHAPN